MLTEMLGKTLTDTERGVIDYINAHEREAAMLTISDIAERAYASNATVSRAIRKCGVENFAELRYRLAAGQGSSAKLAVVNEILARSHEECVRTIENLRVEDILHVIELVRNAKRILIIGFGTTALVAEEFEFQMRCLGYSAWAISDAELIKQMDCVADAEDLVFIFTVNNSSPVLEIAARQARAQGAKLAVCCCRTGTPLEELADIFFRGYTHVVESSGHLGTTSRLTLHMIAQTIVEYFAM